MQNCIALPVFLFLLAGCQVIPSVAEMADVIRKHFESRHYRVIVLRVGGVASLPLGEKTYMGTEGYIVVIEAITLEAGDRDIPGLQDGAKLTFTDATVMNRKQTGGPGGWIVSRISGIPVP